jgi:hypothetical protein
MLEKKRRDVLFVTGGGGGRCQGTSIFFSFTSFMFHAFSAYSAHFHCIYLYYSSMLLSPLGLHLKTSLDFDFTYIILPLCLFLFHFLLLPCLTFISGVSVSFSHIVKVAPLAGPHPFLLGSPAKCGSYCSLYVSIY